MRLVATEYVSLDGIFDEPGEWSFPFFNEEAAAFKAEELATADAQLLGRTTYEGFAKAWPTMEGTGAFGEKMNEMPKFVASTTLRDPDWTNTTVLEGDLTQEVTALKEKYAGDILVGGSSQLVQSLLD